MKDILFADDNKTIRNVMKKNLIQLGLDPLILEDGSQVAEIIESGVYPPIFILDWEMPGKTGPELCQMLKQKQVVHHKFSYVILSTTKDNQEDRITGFSEGADDYLPKPFNIRELSTRIMVGQRTLSYQNQLLENEFKIRVDCYQALTELAETHCLETKDHLTRVGILAEELASRIGANDDFVRDIKMFAPMHDIGKVAVPESLLFLPRELSKEEFQLMKNHTIQGWKILKDKSGLEMAAEIALTHHEHWDGTGYPQGLSSKDIPLSGRITAICDVFDTLRSRRSYKMNWNHQDSVDFIISQRGKSFDPELVDILVSNSSKWLDLYNDENIAKFELKDIL